MIGCLAALQDKAHLSSIAVVPHHADRLASASDTASLSLRQTLRRSACLDVLSAICVILRGFSRCRNLAPGVLGLRGERMRYTFREALDSSMQLIDVMLSMSNAVAFSGLWRELNTSHLSQFTDPASAKFDVSRASHKRSPS